MLDRVIRFNNYKIGMFVHFGLYSIVGKGEWYMHNEQVPPNKYELLMQNFDVKIDWAKKLVHTAKQLGAKYIVITTRHHDGFSLFDTMGLSNYDVMHTPTKRDLIKEFVTECRKENIMPFFYVTMIDWHNDDFQNNFDEYLKYLFASVKLLCTNYGEIGGFWFDGTWFNKSLDWHLNELYSIVRKYQPNAIISNNGGLENKGELLNKEVDCIIFERGLPSNNVYEDKLRAKEMCQILNDHWGYYKTDHNYKKVESLYADYLFCRKNNSNFLLNVGPKQTGYISIKDYQILSKLGKCIKTQK